MCHYIWTTHESVVLEDQLQIQTANTVTPFSIHRLALSIAYYLRSEYGTESADTAYWLAQSIGETLLSHSPPLSITTIRQETFVTLHSFSPQAALRYGTDHGQITIAAKPRRGRPRLQR